MSKSTPSRDELIQALECFRSLGLSNTDELIDHFSQAFGFEDFTALDEAEPEDDSDRASLIEEAAKQDGIIERVEELELAVAKCLANLPADVANTGEPISSEQTEKAEQLLSHIPIEYQSKLKAIGALEQLGDS
ncbi:hypothetical protein [Ferrimonas balearica]|uniref:hypothetical protein n=1 Tax=Ferrimonas balearica TaxID=44012 RepID=UPI001C995B4D|nr:hypothetical protein [Ferrimonas balearica]MBY5922070.1 hypothetical protein [Ferrimonas balearica]MBY5994590.1 hypothetical protein [Ferrimonas balearica]